MYSWRRLFRFAFYLSTLLLQSVLLPPAEVLQPAVGPEQWWFPTATMLQEAAAEPTTHFTAASVLPSVLHDPQQDYLRHFLKDVEQLMSATCAPIPDQPHISKHRLLHAVIALSSFTSSLADPRGFQPRTKNWLSEDPLSEPLTWDMIQSWLEITAMCIAVMSAASSMLLSYCGLQVDVTFHPRPGDSETRAKFGAHRRTRGCCAMCTKCALPERPQRGAMYWGFVGRRGAGKGVPGTVSTAVLLSVRRKAELGGNIWRNQAECQDDRQILF